MRNMAYDPALTVQAIDATLNKCRALGWPEIEVCLHGILYNDLLRLKGMDWTATDMSYDATFPDRPLKIYRGHLLRHMPHNCTCSMVYGRFLSGKIQGWAIIPPRD